MRKLGEETSRFEAALEAERAARVEEVLYTYVVRAAHAVRFQGNTKNTYAVRAVHAGHFQGNTKNTYAVRAVHAGRFQGNSKNDRRHCCTNKQ